MFYKCDLLIGGYVYPVTEHIKNWEDITVSFKRNDYDGVVRTFTDKFEFVKGARVLLLNEYKTNYLKAKANIVIYTRNNSWTWTERFRCALNFSTLSDDGFILSLNAIDDSVASLIKAKKGTQYEFLVQDVKETLPLCNDRLLLMNYVKYTVIPNSEKDFVFGPIIYKDTTVLDFSDIDRGVRSIPIYIEKSEVVRKDQVEIMDQLEESHNGPEDFEGSFMINTSPQVLTVGFKAKMEIFFKPTNNEGGVSILLWGNKTGVKYHNNEFTDNIINVKSIDASIEIQPGESLSLLVAGKRCSVVIAKTIESPTLTWDSRGETKYIDVIKPITLLNSLLKSMNGGVDGLTGVIAPSGEKRLDNAMILAAESARQMPNAKIYSSFTKFCDWMKSMFGYVYDIEGKTITFRHRSYYFGSEVVKKIKDFNDYAMSVNSSLVYSQVNVGYDKQDYDSVNGKDEFRFTNQYTTGITITENRLDIISPYRADAYGIEFLAQKIGEDTTDNSSDTDVFFVCVQSDGDRYTLDRNDTITGVISPSTMFNVMYSPTSMIEANKLFLGGFISELSYASSEGNTAVTINGNAENRNITTSGGLFLANEVEIETSDVELPTDMIGIIEFEHQGEVVQGYYKSTDYHYTRGESVKVTLIVKK